MEKQIKLFERQKNGCLVEIPPDLAEKTKAKRMYSRMSFEADVLFTEEEEQARREEEKENLRLTEWVSVKTEAAKALKITAEYVISAYEDGEVVSDELKEYRQTLRAVVASDTVGQAPTLPEFEKDLSK